MIPFLLLLSIPACLLTMLALVIFRPIPKPARRLDKAVEFQRNLWLE